MDSDPDKDDDGFNIVVTDRIDKFAQQSEKQKSLPPPKVAVVGPKKSTSIDRLLFKSLSNMNNKCELLLEKKQQPQPQSPPFNLRKSSSGNELVLLKKPSQEKSRSREMVKTCNKANELLKKLLTIIKAEKNWGKGGEDLKDDAGVIAVIDDISDADLTISRRESTASDCSSSNTKFVTIPIAEDLLRTQSEMFADSKFSSTTMIETTRDQGSMLAPSQIVGGSNVNVKRSVSLPKQQPSEPKKKTVSKTLITKSKAQSSLYSSLDEATPLRMVREAMKQFLEIEVATVDKDKTISEDMKPKEPPFKLINDGGGEKFVPVKWVLSDPPRKVERNWQELKKCTVSAVRLKNESQLNVRDLNYNPHHKLFVNHGNTFFWGKYRRNKALVKRINIDPKSRNAFSQQQDSTMWITLSKRIATQKQRFDVGSFAEIFDIYCVSHYIFIFMEPATGNTLHYHLFQNRTLCASEVRRWSAQLLNGICYLQNNAIAHRSLRLEHLVLDDKKNLKIINFQRAVLFWTRDTDHPNLIPLRERRTRQKNHMPPEAFNNNYDPRSVDIWSYGVILCLLTTCRYPFPVLRRHSNVEDVWKAFKMRQQSYLYQQICLVLDAVFREDRTKRATISDIQNCEFYQTAKLFAGASIEPPPPLPVQKLNRSDSKTRRSITRFYQ